MASSLIMSRVLYLAPISIAWLVIFILALATIRRNPSASLLSMLAAGAFLLSAALSFGTAFWQQSQIAGGMATGAEMARVLGIVGIVQATLSAISLGLLGAAVFVGRKAAPAQHTGFNAPPGTVPPDRPPSHSPYDAPRAS